MTQILNQNMPAPYKRVAKSVGHALLLGDANAWHGLSVVLTARLTMEERAAMAWAVLRSLPPKHVADVASAVLPDNADTPITPLFSSADEAANWASCAAYEDIKACTLAGFSRLTEHDQSAFLAYVTRRAA